MAAGVEQYIYNQQDSRFLKPQHRLVKHPVELPDLQTPVSVEIYKAKKEQKTPKRNVVQYELDFDRQKARELYEIKRHQPEKYEEEKKAFEGFIVMQLLTALGERFNRGISEFSYRVKDGKLVGEHSDEPFEDVLVRGRDYRKMHGSPVDHPREAAEVVGFQNMQAVMADEETPAGTTMISISPPGKSGSIYKHNFYDGYQKQNDGTVRAIRFSSALSPEETLSRLHMLSSQQDMPQEVTDAVLLSHPIRIDNSMTLEEVHQYLHEDHEVMSEEDFAIIQEFSTSIRTAYISTLQEDPDSVELPLLLNAQWNVADDIKEALDNGTFAERYSRNKQSAYTKNEIRYFGLAPVRAVDTGCGLSGGVSIGESALGTFGVGAFGKRRPEDDPNLCRCGGAKPHFHCPGSKTIEEKQKDGTKKKKIIDCKHAIIVGSGTTKCPECGEMKKC